MSRFALPARPPLWRQTDPRPHSTLRRLFAFKHPFAVWLGVVLAFGLVPAAGIPSPAVAAGLPAPPTQILAGYNDAGGVRLTWTNPLLDMEGAPLSSYGGVTIYRAGYVIASIRQITPDDPRPTSYEDPEAPDGSSYQLSTFDRRNPANAGPLSAAVHLPPRLPDLVFPDTTVTAAWSAGVPPAAWSFTLRNAGYATLTVGLSTAAAWLGFERAEIHVPPRSSVDFVVTADGAGLAEGRHTATLLVSSDDADTPLRTITVNLDIGRPTLGLDLSPLFLGAVHGRATVNTTRLLANGGAGRLSVHSTSDRDWLRVTPQQVALGAGETVEWLVAADPAGLDVGIHDGAIHLVTNDPDHASVTLPVHFTVNPVPPEIGVTPTALTFVRWTNSPPRRQTLTVTNRGEEPLHVTETHGAAWLTVTPHFLTVPGGGSGELALTVDVAGVDPGRFTDTVTLSSDDPEHPQRTVEVRLDVGVAGVPLTLAPESVEVTLLADSPEATRAVRLTNVSPDSLPWEIAELPAWARVSPSHGTLPPFGGVPVGVTLFDDSLGVGDYADTARVIVGAPQPADIPLPLRLRVVERPLIRIEPDTLRYRLGPGTQQPLDLTLENKGAGTQPFQFSTFQGLFVYPSSGTLAPGERRTLTAYFNPYSYPVPFQGTAEISVQFGQLGLHVPVQLDVVDGVVRLEMPSAYLSRPEDAPADTIHWTLRNVGSLHATGFLTWTGPGVHLPAERPTFDLAPGATADLPVVIAPRELSAPGTYNGQVVTHVNEFYGEHTSGFQLRLIGPPPSITTSPAALVFHRQVGDPAETLTLRIGNAGFERLIGQAWARTAWLEVGWYSFSSESNAPGYEQIAADPAGLPAGTYTDVITLDSNDPLKPQITVPVTMIITEPVVPVAPLALAIRQVGLSCFGLGDSAQFVELGILSDDDVPASPHITLEATDHAGAPVLEASDLFSGLAGPLPFDRPWLLAGADFQALTGLAPDRVLPLRLDPLGGVLTLLDATVEPPAILQRFAYGAAGGTEAPAPGGALLLGGNRIMQAVAVAAPANSAGASLPALPAACPVDTLEAGALIRTSRAAGDALESSGPGAAFQRVIFDKPADAFKVQCRDGVARLVLTETFVITGLRAGEELALDAVLWASGRVETRPTEGANAHLRWGLRSPGAPGVTQDHDFAGVSVQALTRTDRIFLPLLQRAGETFTLEIELAAEAWSTEAQAQATLDFYLLPAGVHVVSCGGLVPRPIVPIALAAPLVTADPDRVRLEWRGATAIRMAQLQRRQEETAWRALATLAPDTDGRIVYEDRAVEAGGHYAYRLMVDGEATPAVAVDVPRATAPRLALRAPARVAGGRRIPLSLEVPADGPVALELFDVQGRRVTHAQTTRLSIGHQELTWDVGSLPAAGLYLLRVAQGGQSAVARTMLLH